MVIINSPDLGVLEVKCTFDLTGVNPVINLVNQTTPNPNVSPIPTLNNLIWVLNIYSPTGTPIFQSSFDNPWKTGIWTNAQITNPWPRPMNQIEWSGADYRVEFQVKDSNGTIYPLFKAKPICKPVGNNKRSSTTFGTVNLSVDVLCDKASLYIKDNTSKTYQGITGILNSSYLAVDYPRDPTGVLPAPFEITSFNTDALVPFTDNGEHEATYYSIYTYDLGDNVFVMIRYTAQIAFPVQCNIDLCPIACELKSLEDSVASGRCADVEEAERKIRLITPKLLRAFIAKANPTCGMDLAALVDEIKEIGGFNCDCVNGSTGIGNQSTLIDGLLFTVNNQGGDIVASFSVTGNNVILNVKDKSYTFGSCDPVETTAIKLKTTTSGTNTNVCLAISVADFAADLYSATASSTYLLNLFNSLVIGGGGITLNVDGKCIFSNGACKYTFTFPDIPASPANAILAQIQSTVDANKRLPNYAFNLSTLVALQTYLNTLGIGTFVVTHPSGNTVVITTSTNVFSLTGMVYSVSGGNKKFALYQSDCTGFMALTPSQIVQAIIDYLCGITDIQIKTSQAYAICYIDPATNSQKTATVDSASSLNAFIVALLARGCDTINYIMKLTPLTCAAIQNIFLQSEDTMQPNDYLLGTKVGACARIFPVELGTQILKYGIYNADFMAALRAAIELNAGGKMCDPYTVFNLSAVENSPADNKLDIIVTFTNANTISSLIRYARIDQGGDLNWSVPVNVLPGASPYTINNVDDGQYVVGITPVYADGRKCSEITKTTPVCGTINAFSAVLNGSGHIIVTYSATSPKVRVTINQPNGGVWQQIYTNGASIDITPVAGLIGVFSVTMQPVCNATTSWFGASTAPALVEVTPANNSSFKNNTVTNVSNVQLTAYDINGSQLILNSGTVAANGGVVNFYIPDGFYNQITLALITTGTVYAGTLVASSGSYPLVGGAFTNVTVSGGIAVSIIDASP